MTELETVPNIRGWWLVAPAQTPARLSRRERQVREQELHPQGKRMAHDRHPLRRRRRLALEAQTLEGAAATRARCSDPEAIRRHERAVEIEKDGVVEQVLRRL